MCPITQERRDEVEDDEVMECNVFQRLRVKKGVIIVSFPGADLEFFRGWDQVTNLKGLPVSPALFTIINLTLFSKLLELY